MATFSLTVGGTALPGSKVTGIKRNDELLWSEGTGRAASSGEMTGSVVAAKRTYSVEFGPLTSAEYAKVRGVLGKGSEFARVLARLDAGKDADVLVDGTFYRGAVSGELMGFFGGSAYYGNVSLELVER